mmetsp:Transcript_65565/g.147952  ORF Transcript_65565/g.147952 Transcript_65565/m.147952 type:complete len:231 (+) Transcript_65565:74-766(+)
MQLLLWTTSVLLAMPESSALMTAPRRTELGHVRRFAKGFGKKANPDTTSANNEIDEALMIASSTPTSTVAATPVENAIADANSGLSQEERQEQILRSFGLDKLEDRKEDKESLGLPEMPKNAFDQDGDLNLLAFIPIELQGSIESFFFFTTGTLLFAFLIAGVAITWDAYAVATKSALPEAVASIIYDVIEPNFTNCGLLFLASSSSLGLFKIAQFSNPDIQYTERDPED